MSALDHEEALVGRGWRLVGGTVFTGVVERPWAEAVATSGSKVMAVGTRDEVVAASPGATEIDLAGLLITPGFVDAHNHFLATGEMLAGLDVRMGNLRTTRQLLQAVADRLAGLDEGETLIGSGFDPEAFDSPPPSRFDLDQVAPSQPVVIYHVSGHGALVNTFALAQVGIDDSVVDPAGGRFVRDASGRLTGLCFDSALQQVVPMAVDIGDHGPNFHTDASPGHLLAAVLRAQSAFVAAGMTSVCDAQVTAREFRAYQDARRSGQLALRTSCMPLSHQLNALLELGLQPGFGDDHLWLGPLKLYADGSLTGGTHYGTTIDGDSNGYLFRSAQELHDDVVRAQAGGWLVGVHAQGDLAIDLTLAAFADAQAAAPMTDARPRLEHAGLPTAAAVELMSRLGVVTVSQPGYLFELGDTFRAQLGAQADRVQPLRDQLRAGVRVVISSDSDVASYRPLDTIAAALDRTTRTGDHLGAGQELTLAEALLAHTATAALAIGRGDRLGRLEPGYLADLVVLEDLRNRPGGQIRDATVHGTMIDGRWCYGTVADVEPGG
jgi:predicted amidohydrolase YtcJ